MSRRKKIRVSNVSTAYLLQLAIDAYRVNPSKANERRVNRARRNLKDQGRI